MRMSTEIQRLYQWVSILQPFPNMTVQHAATLDFSMLPDEIGKRAARALESIAAALRGGDSDFLWNDPTRELWVSVRGSRPCEGGGFEPQSPVMFRRSIAPIIG